MSIRRRNLLGLLLMAGAALTATPTLSAPAGVAAGAAAPAPAASTPRRSFLTTEDAVETLDPPTVLFGEVMYDYYNHRNFPAITNLLLARQRRILSDRDDYAEMLLGDLYTSFGLVSQAEEIFNRIIKRDIRARTRNETWFHTAELQYSLGKYDEAARILENKVSDLPPEIEKERVVMLGNIYIGRGEYQRAAELLANVRTDDVVGAYAIYNAGVGWLRAGEVDRGMPLLKRVRDLPPGDEENNALKDRAALAMGFTWLQKGSYDAARESLLTIRMDGPFTNQAMLGLGYANFQRADYKKALPLWLELLQRNTSDTTVQEALMLAPRAYEELGALPQALFGYRYAADTLRSELKKVEKTIVRVRESGWLETLNPVDSKEALAASADPLAPVTGYTPASIPEAPYLYSMFASASFSTDYKHYLELQRIERLIDQWRDQLPIYQDLLQNHRAQLDGQKTLIDGLLARRGMEAESLRTRIAPMQIRIENAIRRADVEQLAPLKQLEQLDTARTIEAILARLPMTPTNLALSERLRRVKGLVVFEIAESYPRNQEQALKDIDALKADVNFAEIHVAALKQIRQDIADRMSADYDRQIAGAARRLQALKDEVIDRKSRQAIILQNQALIVLAENRRNLGAQLAETHLSIARLQDASVSDAIEKRKRQ